MNRIIRYFNQNRKKVYISLIIIVFLFGLLQLLNVMAKNKKEEEKDTSGINEIMQNNKSIVSNKSAVSGTSISEKKLKKDTDVIDNFFKYCNEGNIENAYNLLTDECKEEMYPTIDEFKRIYYNDLFNEGKRTYTIENWFGDTYQVRMTGDILSTGKIDGNQTKQDYVTIVEKDGDYKININNYVGRTKPQDKTTSYKNVVITIDEIQEHTDEGCKPKDVKDFDGDENTVTHEHFDLEYYVQEILNYENDQGEEQIKEVFTANEVREKLLRELKEKGNQLSQDQIIQGVKEEMNLDAENLEREHKR